MSKSVVFAISKLCGGGAEHVIMQLSNFMAKQGLKVELLVTNQKEQAADKTGLQDGMPVYFLEDHILEKQKDALGRMLNSAVCRLFERMHKPIPDRFVRRSFQYTYGTHVNAAITYLQDKKDWSVVAFLQPTIQIMLLSCEKTGNPLVISERGDPGHYFKTRYAHFFLKHYYPQVSWAVFQTLDAQRMFPAAVRRKSSVILNPIPATLPEGYIGTRQKKVVNFCRLDPAKNLPLLVDAFSEFYQLHSDYFLEIYGDGILREQITGYVAEKPCNEAIFILPYSTQLHEKIRDYAMFVSSSDHEGMSNSMLEAMAIGLPTICTDCPIGGAKTVIAHGENGLLVPVGDKNALCRAMCQVAEDTALAQKLSENGQKIRTKQSMEAIGLQWLKIIQEIS